nr:hypothetical protein [Promineifilum sp.]
DLAQSHSLALQQLKRLLEARNAAPPERLATLRAERGATPDGAYRAIAEVARTLGYRGIVFVYDAEADAAKWLRRMVFGQLDRWHARHTSFALFAPVAIYEALTKAAPTRPAVHWPANLEKYALVWSRKELTELARERYVRFRVESKPGTDEQEMRRESVIRAHFEEDGSFERLLDAGRRPRPPTWVANIDGTKPDDDYSPRLFIERWQVVTKGHTYLSKDIVVPAAGAATDAPEGTP